MTMGLPRTWIALAVLAAAAALCACASTPRASRAQPPRSLVAPAVAGEHEVTQVVRAAFGPREMTFSGAVSVKNGVMSVIGLDALGVRLFTMEYDGKNMRAEKAPGMPDAISADLLLADLQLVYWPIEPLQAVLKGFELTEPVAGLRRLRRAGRLIAEVHYASDDPWSGRAWLVNLELGYSLQIDSQP